MPSFVYLFLSVFIAHRESTFMDRFVSFNSVRKVAQIYSACMLEKFSACNFHSSKAINYISVGALKGQCPDYEHLQASSVFSYNNNSNNLIFILRKIHVNVIKCALHESKLSTLISYPK